MWCDLRIALQVGFLFWDGQITQKTLKRSHVEKGEAIWRTVAGESSSLAKQVCLLLLLLSHTRQETRKLIPVGLTAAQTGTSCWQQSTFEVYCLVTAFLRARLQYLMAGTHGIRMHTRTHTHAVS